MPDYSKNIVYLSKTQYSELVANGSITVDGVTVTYDENDVYVTPQEEPVTDVTVAGTSVVTDGVVNIPLADINHLGVQKVNAAYGIASSVNGTTLSINRADNSRVHLGTEPYMPIVPSNQHLSAFYGLAKAAGHDEASSTESVGTYTPEAKGAIQSMLGVSGLMAPEENDLVASRAYAIGDIFTANGKLYKATAAIAVDGAILLPGSVGANCEEVTVADGFPHDVQVDGVSIVQNGVANVPAAVFNGGYGVVKLAAGNGIGVSGAGNLIISTAIDTAIKNGTNSYTPITPYNQEKSVFYGLAKASGDTTQSQSSNAVGTYTEDAKASIRSMIGAANPDDIVAVQDTQPTSEDTKIWLPETSPEGIEVPTVAEMETALAGKVGDVTVNGTSIVSNGVAEIPLASNNTYGVVKVASSDGIYITSDGTLAPTRADISDYKSAGTNYKVVTPYGQHMAVFYGLARAAGDSTQSASSNIVGTYTDEAKIAIQKMLGIYEAPWELIREDTVTNAESADIDITVDGNGQAFELTDALIVLIVPTHSEDTTIDDYGRIYLYNNTTEIRRIYLLNAASKLVQANSVPQIAIGRLLNNNGLMSVDFHAWNANSGRTSLQIVPNPELNGTNTPFAINTNYINRIKIGKITGEIQYRLFGKRKWQ